MSDRELNSDQAVTAVDERDVHGLGRDVAAQERDVAAELRDREASLHDDAMHESDREMLLLAVRDRQHAGAERSWAASARAEAATERAQAVSDRRLAADVRAPRTHDGQRAGDGRERSAQNHDRAAQLLEREAGLHDDAAVESDRQLELRAEGDRKSAAVDRASAAAARAEAATDRSRAGSDRHDAADDRIQAATDREDSETDELTGVRRRGAGLVAIQREIDRARRTKKELVAAYVDVDELKTENDTRGHASGDAVLRALADSMRACLRSYDVITRLGGDEFVCVLSGIPVVDARGRFEEVSAKLVAGSPRCSITIGFARLHPDESADELVARADADLIRARGRIQPPFRDQDEERRRHEKWMGDWP